MTAKQVSVGLTYEVLVSDKLVPVTLTRVCEWGGWYGTNISTGNTVRIATAGRLRKQLDGEKARDEARKQELTANIVHTQTQEATMPTTTAAQRTARSNRRTAKPAATPAKETTVTKPAAAAKKPAAKAKPKAKPAARKRPATLHINGTALKETAIAATDKPMVVKLKIERITESKVQFVYSGTAAEPFVKALYISKDALIEMGEGEITVEFGHYVPTGKQKPMPASAIRYRGVTDAITDLYVNRKQAEKVGFTETSAVSMGISALTEDTIQIVVLPH